MGRRYRLLIKLEEGAFAEHYKGSAEGPGAPDVLIKLFTPKASDGAYAKGLVDAASHTRSLGNPAAVGFDEVGLVQGRIAAIRPFVDGYNLGDALRRLSTKEVVLPPALALYIVAEAAQVVSAAHKTGWIHGAITPGNVLLGADGKVRVVDFGALEAMNASEALRPLATKGRSAYRAPEIKNAGSSSPAADVYSLGAIAYELLTLVSVASSRSGGVSTKRDALTAPSRLDRRINARVDPVIMRALESAATRRYRSAADFAESLRGLFSILGYAPGATEAAKFVKELFPNEVTITAGIGPVPFTEPFSLLPVEGSTSTVDLNSALDERAPFTGPEIPAFDAQSQPPAAWKTAPASIPTTRPSLGLDSHSAETLPPGAKAPAPATKAEDQKLEEWDAPPGLMPQAPSLSRRNRRTAKDPGPLPEDEAASTFNEDRRIKVVDEASGRSDTPAESREVEDAGFDTEEKPVQKTSFDWHAPPEAPKEKPKPPRASSKIWIAGIAVGLSVAAYVYLAYSHKLGKGSNLIAAIGEKVKGAGATTPPQPERRPTDVPEPEQVKPDPPGGPAVLTVESDRQAKILIDNVDSGKSTPLVRFATAPGTHVVTAVAGTETKEKSVVLKSREEERVVFKFGGGKRPAPRPKKTGGK
ncbi:MAG TPA: protein kinase [Myxococcales bacterium]|jgi:serine/threonine-protein kinase